MTARIALALNFIQSLGIVHRDLKRQNIMYDPDFKSVKIIDFGSATKFDEQSDGGTALATAPEVVWNFSHEVRDQLKMQRTGILELVPINEKVDVWALGCIVFELVFFLHPFGKPGEPQDKYYQRLDMVDDIDSLFRDAHDKTLKGLLRQKKVLMSAREIVMFPPIENIIKGALVVDPSERWTSRQIVDESQYSRAILSEALLQAYPGGAQKLRLFTSFASSLFQVIMPPRLLGGCTPESHNNELREFQDFISKLDTHGAARCFKQNQMQILMQAGFQLTHHEFYKTYMTRVTNAIDKEVYTKRASTGSEFKSRPTFLKELAHFVVYGSERTGRFSRVVVPSWLSSRSFGRSMDLEYIIQQNIEDIVRQYCISNNAVFEQDAGGAFKTNIQDIVSQYRTPNNKSAVGISTAPNGRCTKPRPDGTGNSRCYGTRLATVFAQQPLGVFC